MNNQSLHNESKIKIHSIFSGKSVKTPYFFAYNMLLLYTTNNICFIHLSLLLSITINKQWIFQISCR
jgi:hypothetical protein